MPAFTSPFIGTKHACGGTIIGNALEDETGAMLECIGCGAFMYIGEVDPPYRGEAFPTGTDRVAIQAAFDALDSRSPDAS